MRGGWRLSTLYQKYCPDGKACGWLAWFVQSMLDFCSYCYWKRQILDGALLGTVDVCLGVSRIFPSVSMNEWVKSLSCVWLFATPWTVAYHAPPSMGFFRQEYWSGLPFPSPEDLPDPGIEPRFPTLQADTLPSEPSGIRFNTDQHFASFSLLTC